jgi:transposase
MVEGRTHQQVAVQCRVCPHTVGSWRIGFLAERLAGLADIPRPGAPRRISDVQLAQVVRLTLETKPKKATHWSTRSIAVRCGMSNERIARIWQAFGLQPHRSESFQLFTDPFFVEKVRDVVGLYQSPPQNALVLCVDEKSQIQALERSQPMLPLRPGQPERHTSDYFRQWDTLLVCGVGCGDWGSLCAVPAAHTLSRNDSVKSASLVDGIRVNSGA